MPPGARPLSILKLYVYEPIDFRHLKVGSDDNKRNFNTAAPNDGCAAVHLRSASMQALGDWKDEAL
jgi:hypothetical protein